MVRSAIQLYTLRDLDVPFDDLLERVADAGFDGVEFAYRVGDEDPEAVAATLDRLGLDVAGAHVPHDSLADDYAATTAFYGALGCDRIVVPAFDAERFADRDAVADAAADLTALAERLAADGFDCCYHNHEHEFAALDDGERAYEAFVAAAGDAAGFEFDAGLAFHAGADPVSLLGTLAGRVPLLHFTDTVLGDGARVHADFGTGDLDVPTVADAARDAGADWFVYENGVSDDPAGQLAHAAETFATRW